MKKAVVLLSGGLDSSTCLAVARSQGYACYALSFDYGQRHNQELKAAANIAKTLGACAHQIVTLNLQQFGGSALVDHTLEVPTTVDKDSIPITYVPARNTIFLSIALGYAETIEAQAIFIGVSAVDYSNYPDCRPEFIQAFQDMAKVGTKAGVEGSPCSIIAPLLHLSKADTIRLGMQLGVDYAKTVSCYQLNEDSLACGKCPSCILRQQGFIAAGLSDPTPYK